MRTITYSIATQYTSGPYKGYYNSTYLWYRLDAYLNFWSEYFAIQFQRVSSGGAIQVIQANRPNPNPAAWMWAQGRSIFVSPVVNYGRNDWYCGMPTGHELCHLNNTSHLPAGNVMAPAGSRDNYTQLDCQRYLPYPWRSSRRPWLEPTLMQERFRNTVMLFSGKRLDDEHNAIRASFGLTDESPQAEYECCSKQSFWGRIIPTRWSAI